MSGFGTFRTSRDVRLESGMRERDSTGLNHARRPFSCLSMISGQTLRVCPEGKPVPTFPDHALMRLAEDEGEGGDENVGVGVADMHGPVAPVFLVALHDERSHDADRPVARFGEIADR